MTTKDPRSIGKIVQDQLRKMGSPASRARVLTDEVVPQDGGAWWYVPVSIHRDTEHMAEYYEAFSTVEEKLEDEQSLSVLLVPRIVPFQKWQDVADIREV